MLFVGKIEMNFTGTCIQGFQPMKTVRLEWVNGVGTIHDPLLFRHIGIYSDNKYKNMRLCCVKTFMIRSRMMSKIIKLLLKLFIMIIVKCAWK